MSTGLRFCSCLTSKFQQIAILPIVAGCQSAHVHLGHTYSINVLPLLVLTAPSSPLILNLTIFLRVCFISVFLRFFFGARLLCRGTTNKCIECHYRLWRRT